ncbi:L,D-transpeptidase family protein [Pseudomonas benzenivorans]|uniref:L,D-transpeptidase family protein n=1 Tax=Pseudomonas benzenivorans TaxID=556533 RepID=A0ABZ0PY53_9PSED|nr:L,D-transpeptidase family protein [Pseudomonas benzenivorans]WPC05409.1 L,D-transpeptidase family protein [Pseudomonas benzenivorans]
MYKKSAHGLITGCLLASAALAQGADERSADAIRLTFAQRPEACAPGIAAGELQPRGLLQRLYARHGFAPLWQQPGRRTALLNELTQLRDDGLDPADYPLAAPAEAPGPSAQQRACADLLASRSYLQALQHLAYGRLPQASIEPFWRAPDSLSPIPRPDLLELAWRGLDEPAQAFNGARPALPQYQALRRAYAERRRQPPAEWTPIAPGRLLRPGMRDARVAQLATRLVSEGYLESRPASDNDLYDPPLLAAVLRFQANHGLQADGLVGPATLHALNTSAAERLDQLRVNLERWRWLAGDIEAETLLVDIAGGLLSYYRDHRLLWQGRTVVGRPDRQTPQLKSLVSRLTLNPTWSVPPTILREDKLPEILRDPSYLERHQLRVIDYAGNPVDPAGIDWENPGRIILRQDAGPTNPLGQLAIRFANPYSVYLHDTPSRHLFAKSPRAFSSGCVRIEGILELLQTLLPADDCAEILRRLASRRTQSYPITRRLPIVMAYWTAQVAADGALILRNDFYARDAALLTALNQAGH